MTEACKLCGQSINDKVLAGRVIALDVGHGWGSSSAYDVGAQGNGTVEQVINAKVAYRVADLLRPLGATVHIFDYADNGSPRLWLSEKGKRAGTVKADVFVSIHHNAFDGSAQGTETLVHSQATAADQVLARAIQKHLVEATKFTDRGLKWKQLGVLSGCPSEIPACLTEAFFIDWRGFKGAIPEALLEAEAVAISQGIREFLVSAFS